EPTTGIPRPTRPSAATRAQARMKAASTSRTGDRVTDAIRTSAPVRSRADRRCAPGRSTRPRASCRPVVSRLAWPGDSPRSPPVPDKTSDMTMTLDDIQSLLGAEAGALLEHHSSTISRESLHLPGSDFIDRVFATSDRPIPVLSSLQRLFWSGRLGGTGYVSILPVDQGIEHSAGASFAPNPPMFDPETIVRLAVEGGCNAVASTFGGLAMVARRWAHKIPFIVKVNHNEFLSYPNIYDQTMYGSVKTAYEMGAAG